MEWFEEDVFMKLVPLFKDYSLLMNINDMMVLDCHPCCIDDGVDDTMNCLPHCHEDEQQRIDEGVCGRVCFHGGPRPYG